MHPNEGSTLSEEDLRRLQLLRCPSCFKLFCNDRQRKTHLQACGSRTPESKDAQTGKVIGSPYQPHQESKDAQTGKVIGVDKRYTEMEVLTRGFTQRYVKGTMGGNIFWIPSKQLKDYSQSGPSTNYHFEMMQWFTSHRLDTFLVRAHHTKLTYTQGGVGVLLVDKYTRGAKLVDGRKRLWCAITLGVPLFPVQIRTQINAPQTRLQPTVAVG